MQLPSGLSALQSVSEGAPQQAGAGTQARSLTADCRSVERRRYAGSAVFWPTMSVDKQGILPINEANLAGL